MSEMIEEIADALYGNSDLQSKAKAECAVKAAIAEIAHALRAVGRAELRGFGVFTVRDTPARQGRIVSLVQTHKQKPEVLPAQQHEAATTADPTRAERAPTETEYLAALTIVRDLETRGAYRLTRLRNADGSERLTWRAPEIG